MGTTGLSPQLDLGRIGAVVVAGGKSTRMGEVDKIFASLRGKALIAHVLDVFCRCNFIDDLVLVLDKINFDQGRKLLEEYGWSDSVKICPGGPRRQDSVKEGLRNLAPCEWVVIHDGARPCIDVAMIERGLAVAHNGGAAVAAVPARETIKMVGQDGLVEKTPPRQSLWIAQTPQVFRFDIIDAAHRQTDQDVTDDAMMVELLGYKVKVFMGSYENLKVTTREDLALAEITLAEREEKEKNLW